MADKRPIQHTPVHLRDETKVFDRRHPAASSFAPLQPAAGVVADDVEERGQNLRGGPTASQAQVQHRNQGEELQKQYTESLERSAGTVGPAATVDGDKATPAKSSSSAGKGK